MRLCADENFPLAVVEALRRLGYDILTLNRKHFFRLYEENPRYAV